MPLSAGTRLGSYEVIEAIGAGGMGEVYRARDSKLNRDVAIKVLSDLVAGDPDRLARFRREAQVLASLNHPNIGHIYGLEEFLGVPGSKDPGLHSQDPGLRSQDPGPHSQDPGLHSALILELVEGPTLADRIALGPIPLAEALPIARQIADAVEAAHEQGIIHRDLKPANIKVRDDGTVKVLDFGLAKALDPVSPSASAVMNSPTLTARSTQLGMILGTAAYMAPEQARGKAVDRRADVWAFGVVLYEMLTGRRAFAGEEMSDVLAAVLKETPPLDALPADTPEAIRRLLRRCLEKDPKKRLSSMSDVRLELTETDAAPAEASVKGATAAPSRARWPLALAALAGTLVTAVGFLFVAPAFRSVPSREPSRVSVLGPEGVLLSFEASDSAISPDGRKLVFTTLDPGGAYKLWLRDLSAVDATPIPGTETGHLPFWSPDSRQIAFFSADKLKKVPADGGTIETLCDAKDGRGGTWGTGDVIVFAPANAGALQRVSANGGDPKPVTTLDAARGETGHRFPWFLPDGQHFLFATLPMKNQKFDIFVGSLDGTRSDQLMSSEGAAIYAEPGYLLFARKNVLVAQPFDARARSLSGEPHAIGDAPSSLGGLYSAGRAVSVSTTGAIAYLGDRQPDTKLVWVDRSGRQTGTLAVPDGRYQELSFSPDGRHVAMVRFANQNDSDIWIADADRGGATRFTSSAGANTDVVWSPEGDRMLFASDRGGQRDFFMKPASGATLETPFYASKVLFKDSRSWSPDGKWLSYEELDPKTNRDLWVLPMEGDRTPKPYLQTPFNETTGAISPDGHWLAYLSDESGQYEVYVDAFPTPRNKVKVTDHGAFYPFWRKDGRELAIVAADARSLLVSETTLGTDFHFSPPHQWLALPKGMVAVAPSPDFQRVLLTLPVNESTTSTLTIVFDWLGALSKK